MRMWVRSVGWRSGIALSCGVGWRRGSDPALLGLGCKPAAVAPISPLAWEPTYASGMAKKSKKKKKKKGGGSWGPVACQGEEEILFWSHTQLSTTSLPHGERMTCSWGDKGRGVPLEGGRKVGPPTSLAQSLYLLMRMWLSPLPLADVMVTLQLLF